ncbi:PhzF family phenazine biosynthesis protein [Kribbella solani]|uniref:PhzF family phenazine biosynthesis protein n=1 Tax=Kribbella solani TaxID=236067 RepID=UPI0029B89034|nr:PhzF family phenazine biosynthesis protein [Kribbella solani]MDX2968515.1 PhzF family phenazine biosynthesis protein [Kribbella solani]MDX3003874.1 PhzF family phenazine biosynthesis protein [Kribbella solani]
MRIRVVDAFAERAFVGNQAGVCVLEAGDWPDEKWMQAVAAEMNHAETAFVRPSAGAEADWDLRWFTPTNEEKLCGHATLATAHVLASDGKVTGKASFSTLSGVLVADVADDGITLDFPVNRPVAVDVPAGLVAALGLEPLETYIIGDLRDLLVVVPDEATVLVVVPDFDGLEVITKQVRLRGIIVTAPSERYDFVSRFFAPGSGIPEDPVTGSAHTGLAPYWGDRLGRDELVGYQASARGGVVRVKSSGDRVLLTGHAITVLDGQLLV